MNGVTPCQLEGALLRAPFPKRSAMQVARDTSATQGKSALWHEEAKRLHTVCGPQPKRRRNRDQHQDGTGREKQADLLGI
jgi:hypothetical protein